MEQKELRQLQNSVEIIGTLKSKNLEPKVSKKGKPYMSGDLTVVTVDGDKINEHRVKIFIMESSKLYKGIETVRSEYKSVEEVGPEAADRIRVTGEMTLNEYYNRDGKLVQFNEIKGVFFNRLEDDTPDRAIASIETVIEEFTDKLDSEGLPTGEKTVKGFTVAWGNNVVELRNAVVKDQLAEAMMELYQPFSTGRLSFKLNNYVEKVEQEAVANVQHGFGSTATVEPNVINNFTNNIEIIGGDIPFFGSKEYTHEEIEEAHKVRQLALQTLEAPAPETPQQTTGFGSNGIPTPSDQDDPFLSNSDMPDF